MKERIKLTKELQTVFSLITVFTSRIFLNI